MLETKASLSVGQEVVIALPEAESSPARVVWENDKFFGCVFDQPLPPAAVSAARLKSEPQSGPPSMNNLSMNNEVERTNSIVFSPFGSRLQRMRKERGLSVVELARRMKVSRPTVWSWEAGKSSPRPSKFASLSAIFDVTEEELRGSGGGSEYEGLPHGPIRGADALQSVIAAMKARIAEVAGTSSEKVKIIIEV